MNSPAPTDRYLSFCGIDCDGNAHRFMTSLRAHLDSGHGDPRWQEYFRDKLALRDRLKQDELCFIGAQMNQLYSYLEDCADEPLSELLYQLEQECC